MQQLGTVGKKNWGDRPVYIVGGGPTLKPFADKLWLLYQRGYVLAVNDSYKNCYFPDAIFSLDHTWLSKNVRDDSLNGCVRKIPHMPGPVFVAADEVNMRVECENLTYLHRSYRGYSSQRSFLSEDPGIITNGMNSGFGALNFAYLKGAKIIYLLGFDFKDIGDKTHFHSGYKWHNRLGSNALFPRWAEAFNDTMAQLNRDGVQVFNCSPDSLLTCFPHKPYAEVL